MKGKFGHSKDPVTDYCAEVASLVLLSQASKGKILYRDYLTRLVEALEVEIKETAALSSEQCLRQLANQEGLFL